ncbi:MAG TPA: nitrilase-related carbon-nitrogen hydrolase [Phycisphaerales bacterium]|nr:nitrilase-related carbon-nitrogen hydrolase [Phycisphaerales bacterium]
MGSPSDSNQAVTSARRAHLVQLDIAWEDPAENHERVRQLLDRAEVSPGDLVLLPEMFATGFSFNIQQTNDRTGQTLALLAEIAAEFQCFVQGGRTVAACHQVACGASNVMTVVSPSGKIVCEYTKIHPFSIGGEHETFAPGREVVVWDWAFGGTSLKVAPAICYDLRFPELFRTATLRQGAEVFALGACWPVSRQHHWRALAIARAIEDQAYMLAVNRTGRDPRLEYAGGSIAVSSKGEILGELGPEPGVLSVEVDAREVRRWREKFPALGDARLFPTAPRAENSDRAPPALRADAPSLASLGKLGTLEGPWGHGLFPIPS